MTDDNDEGFHSICIVTVDPATMTTTLRRPVPAEIDVDPVEPKYKKRHRRYQSPLTRLTAIATTLAACISLIRLLLISDDSSSRYERFQRAKEILRERAHGAAPHWNDDDKGMRHFADRSESELQDLFAEARESDDDTNTPALLKSWLKRLDETIVQNARGGPRWIRPYLLPSEDDELTADPTKDGKHNAFFSAQRMGTTMAWEQEWKEMIEGGEPIPGPVVDYTPRDKYEYPELTDDPTGYPKLKTIFQLMYEWDQDHEKEGVIEETLLHFNYSDPKEREMALIFREAEVPFKVYDVPEVSAATLKWTDEYVAKHFRNHKSGRTDSLLRDKGEMPAAEGTAQESPNHYFAFYNRQFWDLNSMGLPPTRDNDFTFERWAQHARYADAKRLSSDQPHYYWQSGVDRNERYEPEDKRCFISQDLPSWSDTEENFFQFSPDEQKGIQCRFGERGVVAATHYDGGRNMVAMVTGAKRYILSPPNQCSKLGIFTDKKSPIFRHSLLNFGHIKYLNEMNDMSEEEHDWLERASASMAVETVLKAGEVLYIPSHWFHYIISVQKSAQCNVRSGVDKEGTAEFGGLDDVMRCRD